MPLYNPYVIVGKTVDGVEHFINVQTGDVGLFTMIVRMLSFSLRSAYRNRYELGIYLKRYNDIEK